MCPICKSIFNTFTRKCTIDEREVFKCKQCEGYFIYPVKDISYIGSHWTEKREDYWNDDVSIAKLYARRIIDFLNKTYSINVQNILELGCGSGFMGIGFQSLGVCYRGIDVDRESIGFAQKKGLDVLECSVENFHASSYSKKQYDLIISSNTFEHVNDPYKAFQILAEHTKKCAVIIVPNPEGLLPRLKKNAMYRFLLSKMIHDASKMIYTIDGKWHNIAYTKKTIQYFCFLFDLKIKNIRSISVNDYIFGFVQPNPSFIYSGVSKIMDVFDCNSQVLSILTPKHMQ